MLLGKVLGENEKCVFYFYLKTEGTFLPTQYNSLNSTERQYTVNSKLTASGESFFAQVVPNSQIMFPESI